MSLDILYLILYPQHKVILTMYLIQNAWRIAAGHLMCYNDRYCAIVITVTLNGINMHCQVPWDKRLLITYLGLYQKPRVLFLEVENI